MNIRKTALTNALASVLGFAAIGAQAAALNNGDQLTINPGVTIYSTNGSPVGVSSGSYFAFDGNGNRKISGTEKMALSQGSTGIIIGLPTIMGAAHVGAPTVGDANAIDAPWNFFGNTGSVYTTTGITGSTTAGLNMSGWTVTWATLAAIPMGSGAWQTGTGTGHTGATGIFADGVGNFTWNGVYGAAYSLDYRATVPLNDPSGFGGCYFEWHLEGIVNAAVPVPAAVWLFGSGLVGLLGIGRRKRAGAK